MKNWKAAPLALAPLLGCLALAAVGANRPEQIIVGRWRVGGAEHCIEFKADGTFVQVEAQVRREMPVMELSRLRTSYWRTSGRYWFPARDRLQLDLSGPKIDISPTPAPMPQPTSRPSSEPVPDWVSKQAATRPARCICGVGGSSDPNAPAPVWSSLGMTIAFDGDTAQVQGSGSGSRRQIWRRTEKMLTSPTAAATPAPTLTGAGEPICRVEDAESDDVTYVY